VTPLSPLDWKLIYDGESISLDPSIGNWSFKCRSHYWIRQGRVVWAPRWSRDQIAAGREADWKARDQRSRPTKPQQDRLPGDHLQPAGEGVWRRFLRWLS
jgi:hypothetical protein